MTRLLGIDVGTSAIKAGVFDETGSQLALAHRPTPVVHPAPGFVEAVPDAVWRETAAAMREAISHSGDGRQITAIGVTGMAQGAWLVTAGGQAVRQPVLWNDGRAAAITGRWQREGVLASVFRVSGNALSPGSPISILRWLLEHEPATLERADHLLLSKDWVRLNLTGDAATDPSDASYVPFDVRTCGWSPDVLALCGLDEEARLLPPIHASDAVAGTVRRSVADEVGLAPSCQVAVGVADTAAATLGAGATTAGVGCVIFGSGVLSTMLYDAPILEPVDVGMLAVTANRLWSRQLANYAGTLNLSWLAEVLFGKSGDEQFARLAALAAAAPPGSRGLLYHPYLSAAGQIAPEVRPGARANIFGLRRDHGLADLVRSVYEGVVLAVMDCFSSMPHQPSSVLLVGGGSRSALWCQMLADALNVEVSVPTADEPGALGAAMVAGVASGVYPSYADAAESCIRIGARYSPGPDVAAFAELLPRYRSVAQALDPMWWDELGDMS